MRGVAFSALLGLSDFRKDALASALHVYYLQRKYPYAEMSLSCPRLRPIINNDKISPLDVHETQLCQILCAYRIFLPYVGITVSSRMRASTAALKRTDSRATNSLKSATAAVCQLCIQILQAKACSLC